MAAKTGVLEGATFAKLETLEPSKLLFIRRWGELSGYWGINRTMAEIHALLFVSTDPVCTDDVMEKLLISRGNASMNLRSLVDWGLIERIHIRGDRKEYFICRSDVWQMFETILQQRRRREVEPILETIDRCLETAGNEKDVEVYRQRLKEMREFLHLVGSLVDLVVKLGPDALNGIALTMSKMAG
ncbi:MAG TPA: MarR family transcriptional regulator [Phycisphaerae bacterium]|nr:MarR family transcriptional regulator [Phycisphaerae bacterium]